MRADLNGQRETVTEFPVGRQMRISVVERDIGHGQESFTAVGRFTGEVDTWGKWTFESDVGTMFLFPDEVVEATEVS